MAIQLSKPPIFGEWLKERRKARDLTQAELARQIGCAEVTLRKLEAGAQRPSKPMAMRLAEVLEIAFAEQDAFVHFARGDSMSILQSGLSARPHWSSSRHTCNLPSQPTPLIGREREIAAISKRLVNENQRLVTLTGAPGVGKTSLAIEVAGVAAHHFSDGVAYVPLATVPDPSLAPLMICQSLHLQESGLTATERLKLYLSEKHLLLVLDNFEHLLAAAVWVAELLAACPWLTILATSRAPLRVRIERQVPILPLALPNLAHLPSLEELESSPAIALFVERAQAAQPDFRLTTANMETVATICTHLDGLPLAIELVAARVRVLSPTMLLARLGGHLLLDSAELRDLTPRHQSLRQAIDWSYHLLMPSEQRLLAWLGVFVGGFTLEIVEEVCGGTGNPASDIVELLTSLVDKNLVYKIDGLEREPRFLMLETIHEYALERLAASGEDQVVRRRHAEAFLRLAESADPHLRDAEQLHWLAVLEAEHDNLRAALTWALGEEGDPLLGLRLVNALSRFWFMRAYYAEGSRWLDRALAQAGDTAPAQLRGWALAYGSLLAGGLDDFPRGWRMGDTAFSLAHTLNDHDLLIYASNHLSNHCLCQNDLERAGAVWREGLATACSIGDRYMRVSLLSDRMEGQEEMILPEAELPADELLATAKESGDRNLLCMALWHLAREAELQGGEAIHFYEDGLVLARQLQDQRTIIFRLARLAERYNAQGNRGKAEALCREAIDVALRVGTPGLTAMCFKKLGELSQTMGKPDEALRRYRQCLEMVKGLGHNLFVADCLTVIASLITGEEPPIEVEYAFVLLGAADSSMESSRWLVQRSSSLHLQEFISSARVRLSDPVLAAAWAKGKAMSIDSAIKFALG